MGGGVLSRCRGGQGAHGGVTGRGWPFGRRGWRVILRRAGGCAERLPAALEGGGSGRRRALLTLPPAVPPLQAIEDEGGNPDEIEITSEGSKKAAKRSSKGTAAAPVGRGLAGAFSRAPPEFCARGTWGSGGKDSWQPHFLWAPQRPCAQTLLWSASGPRRRKTAALASTWRDMGVTCTDGASKPPDTSGPRPRGLGGPRPLPRLPSCSVFSPAPPVPALLHRALQSGLRHARSGPGLALSAPRPPPSSASRPRPSRACL